MRTHLRQKHRENPDQFQIHSDPTLATRYPPRAHRNTQSLTVDRAAYMHAVKLSMDLRRDRVDRLQDMQHLRNLAIRESSARLTLQLVSDARSRMLSQIPSLTAIPSNHSRLEFRAVVNRCKEIRRNFLASLVDRSQFRRDRTTQNPALVAASCEHCLVTDPSECSTAPAIVPPTPPCSPEPSWRRLRVFPYHRPEFPEFDQFHNALRAPFYRNDYQRTYGCVSLPPIEKLLSSVPAPPEYPCSTGDPGLGLYF